MKNTFSMLLPLTSELYPTLYRTLGYGLASAVGRVGAFLSAFVVFPLYFVDTYLPFISFFAVCFIAMITTFTIPYDTTMRYLD